MTPSKNDRAIWLSADWQAIAVVVVTLVGLAFRLARLGDPIFGDELSTLYIISNNGFLDTVHAVASDAEITPPLYFVLSWFAVRLGDAPELLRLVSLIAGTASIPLTYLLGVRTVGRTPGALAAAVMALSPFMIFYSTDGRAYALAIALVLGSTLSMLAGARTGRARWWVAYGACSSLAMYSHYTAAFVLIAQIAWLFWAHPAARRPCLVANVIAAVGFAPWIGGFLADMNSPTIDILSALQGDGFLAKRLAVENWAFGYPYFGPNDIPGLTARLLLGGGVAVAAVAALFRLVRRSSGLSGILASERSKGVVLVFLLAIAVPLAEVVILLLGGSDLVGARNFNLSTAGLALSIGTVIAGAGPLLGVLCAVAVFGGYSIGAVKTLPADATIFDAKSATAFIKSEAKPGEPVVDLVPWLFLSPVPLTSFDVYLPPEIPDYALYLPQGEPPFLDAPLPDADGLLRQAFAEAAGGRLFVAGPPMELKVGSRSQAPEISDDGALVLPFGSKVVERKEIGGASGIEILVVQVDRRPQSWMSKFGAP